MQDLEHLVVVVGQGHHSEGGVQRIRPAAEQLLRERGLSFSPRRRSCRALGFCAMTQGLEHLVVVVGQGHHSAGGVQRIRPAAEQLLRECGLAFSPGRPNAGCLWVELPAGAAAPRGFFARIRALLGRLCPGGGCGMFAAGYGG